jgi:hypothetical protein
MHRALEKYAAGSLKMDTPETRDEEWNAMAHTFIGQVLDISAEAARITIYRDLTSEQKVECFIAGVMVGLFAVALESMSTAEGRDYIENYIRECIPTARRSAEKLLE